MPANTHFNSCDAIIPALVSSRFSPVDIVKGSLSFKTIKTYSKILISMQYLISTVLLTGTFTIALQSTHLKNHDLGFDTENLFWMEIVLPIEKLETLRGKLKSIPGVEEVSFCQGSPILNDENNLSLSYEGRPISFQVFLGDSIYMKILGLKVTPSGNSYTPEGVWHNRAALRALQQDSDVLEVRFKEARYTILGIVEDFNFQSLHN